VDTSTILQILRQKGVTVVVEGDRLRFSPKEAVTPELLSALKELKSEIIASLTCSALAGPGCQNTFTPHDAHKLPWECDPYVCDCYRLFGYPRWCQGVPCRWVWPQEKQNGEAT